MRYDDSAVAWESWIVETYSEKMTSAGFAHLSASFFLVSP